ncbi:MAG: uracil-DNA glycosylase [Tepidimonas sp.]|uniref:uracil-DNA glycosylase n=1 Tax=Tepidimonas sp. TaxID=2002775 RepID=UPI0040550DC0
MATPLRRALPHLDERHTAMLCEMGIAPWWTPRELLPRPMAQKTPPSNEKSPGSRTAPPPKPGLVDPAPALPPLKAPPPAAASPSTWAAGSAAAACGHAEPSAQASPEAMATLDWDGLTAAICTCQRCGLAQGRQRAVPGVGDRRPTWLIVGEAPGEEEDRLGEPFVGRAGQLLNRMLAAMGLAREQGVYITNVIKCRPPRNRNPEPAEMACCTPYLLRQIALLQPRIAVAMGRFAAQTLLAQGGCDTLGELLRTPLGRLRGRVYSARLANLTLPVVVTYHPAYLLRSPAEKAKAWADLCLALETAASLPPRA